MHDSHPWLKHLQDHFLTDDPEQRDQTALQSFTKYSPHERTDIIRLTDQAIGDVDVNLRQRSQLMQFSTKLKVANSLLRKVGR
jgi:hypothetical protein